MNLRDPSAPALDSLIDKVQSRLNARATAATREWWTKYLRGAASFRGAKMRDVRTAVHAWFEEERLGEHFSILRSGQVHGPGPLPRGPSSTRDPAPLLRRASRGVHPAPLRRGVTATSAKCGTQQLRLLARRHFPGEDRVREVGAAFYSYTLPEPAGFPDQPILPERASYDSQLGEFLPSYDDVRATADPGRAILDFAQCTYEAVARLRGWSMDELALQDEHPPRPRERPQETSEIATRKAPTGWRC